MQDFTILVAVSVTANNRAHAHEMVHEFMPNIARDGSSIAECWWVAEDDRRDNSDSDSAVFVEPGKQERASALLFGAGLTPSYNVVRHDPVRSPNRFDDSGEMR